MTNISITPEALAPIVSAAILQHLSTDERDALITQALTYLVTPPKVPYGQTAETPLQEALRTGVRNAAHQVIVEVLDTSGIAEQIRDQLTPKIEEMVKNDSTVRALIADGVASALRDRLERQWS